MIYVLDVKQVTKETGKEKIFSVSSENHKTILSCFKHSLDICRTLGKNSEYYFWLKDVVHLLSQEVEDIQVGIKTPQRINKFYYQNQTYHYFVDVTIN